MLCMAILRWKRGIGKIGKTAKRGRRMGDYSKEDSVRTTWRYTEVRIVAWEVVATKDGTQDSRITFRSPSMPMNGDRVWTLEWSVGALPSESSRETVSVVLSAFRDGGVMDLWKCADCRIARTDEMQFPSHFTTNQKIL